VIDAKQKRYDEQIEFNAMLGDEKETPLQGFMKNFDIENY